jgi:hypothetical protein
MNPSRLLLFNASSTAACAIGMLAARGGLYPLFGLHTPALLDVLAVGLFVYAGALVIAARRDAVDRATLMAFAIVDGLWVAGSAVVLVLFWTQFSPLARILVIAVALVVEVFAALQYRAAGPAKSRTFEAA